MRLSSYMEGFLWCFLSGASLRMHQQGKCLKSLVLDLTLNLLLIWWLYTLCNDLNFDFWLLILSLSMVSSKDPMTDFIIYLDYNIVETIFNRLKTRNGMYNVNTWYKKSCFNDMDKYLLSIFWDKTPLVKTTYPWF